MIRKLAGLVFLIALSSMSVPSEAEKVDGYRGIWFELGQKGEYGDKYSGGLGTYTAKHKPIAVYSPEANKTFFVYGGTKEGERHLLIMASYYDHAKGGVPQPTLVHDKQGVDDPHDNASVALDGAGHVWVFVSGRGRGRPGFKYRSLKPNSVESFEQISEEEMTYPQPWHVQDRGFLHLFTMYTKGRELYWNTSVEGRAWTSPKKLAGMGGHYQSSNQKDGKVITAFNMHPGGTVDKRTNLYYAQTEDFGRTWTTAAGEILRLPLEKKDCPALVRDYEAEGRLVYMKDTQFDEDGNPVLLVVTSAHHMPGPKGDPRTWTVVRWTGEEWLFHEVTTSTHNYDMGSLWIEEDGTWRIIGPTEAGPQRYGCGGEMAVWVSDDKGATWKRANVLTRDSPMNHTYARRPRNAHPGFYAFWADGNPDEFSESRLYFTNRDGEGVWGLPSTMDSDFAVPEKVF